MGGEREEGRLGGRQKTRRRWEKGVGGGDESGGGRRRLCRKGGMEG